MTLLKIIISDTVLLALITSITGLITLWINNRLGKIHKQINSRMDELVKLNRAEAAATGKLEGKAEEKAETSASVTVTAPGIVSETKIEGKIVDAKIEGVIKPNTDKK